MEGCQPKLISFQIKLIKNNHQNKMVWKTGKRCQSEKEEYILQQILSNIFVLW